MINDRVRFWLYLAATYAVLVLPFAITFVVLTERNRPEVSLLDYGPPLLLLSLWPLSLVVGVVIIWYMGAVAAFLFWKYAEMLQFFTRIPSGSRIGRAIARDHFFARAASNSPYAWVHRQAIAAYPDAKEKTGNA
ncbi:MAG: hypothetical protein RIR95_1388 [Pseudomonadota bacterium]|jgi:uncharacterized membrane protein